MKTRTLTFTLSILLTVAARAELKWEQTTIQVHPAVGDKAAVAHFKYENVGKTPVHFKSVKASCGCTTTQTQKEVVNPGGKGEVVATFNFGDRLPGPQVKTVSVQTDEPPPAQSNITLTLQTNIPSVLEVSPQIVQWQSGEEPKTKKILVKAAKDFPAKELTIKSNSQNFESKVEPGKTSGEWTVEVTPKDTSHPIGTALQLVTDYPKDSPKAFYVNAVVTAAPGAPGMLRPNSPVAPALKTATPAAIPSPAAER